jgi:hypothetical protein
MAGLELEEFLASPGVERLPFVVSRLDRRCRIGLDPYGSLFAGPAEHGAKPLYSVVRGTGLALLAVAHQAHMVGRELGERAVAEFVK